MVLGPQKSSPFLEKKKKGEQEEKGEGKEKHSSRSSNMIPILQAKKLKLREVKEIAQDNTVSNRVRKVPNLLSPKLL